MNSGVPLPTFRSQLYHLLAMGQLGKLLNLPVSVYYLSKTEIILASLAY